MLSNMLFNVSGLDWNMNIELETPKQYISLPGFDQSFHIKCKRQIPIFAGYFSMTSFVDHTMQEKIYFGQWEKCARLDSMINFFCLRVTINSNYLVIGNLNSYLNDVGKQHKLSWTQATELCQTFGGELPSFMSRDEMDEVIALLLKSKNIPYLEAIFIGLRFSETKVSGSRFILFKFKITEWCNPAV